MLIDELRTIGQACYGDRWQSQLARAIPMTERNLRYILAGRKPLAPWLSERIHIIARQRQAELALVVQPYAPTPLRIVERHGP
jgi:hypothetical protein